MTKKRNNGGFTLAEMLIVVAIIIILMGVAFVAVQNHQRSMTRLEFDGTSMGGDRNLFFKIQDIMSEVNNRLKEPEKEPPAEPDKEARLTSVLPLCRRFICCAVPRVSHECSIVYANIFSILVFCAE